MQDAEVTKRRMPVGRHRWAELARLRAYGGTPTEIAKEMGLSAGTVSEALKHPEIMELVSKAQAGQLAEVRGRVVGVVRKALDYLSQVLEDEKQSPSLRVRVAQDLLDRAGVVAPRGPVVEINATQDGGVSIRQAAPGSAIPPEDAERMSDDQLNRALSTLNELRSAGVQPEPDVIDADISEEDVIASAQGADNSHYVKRLGDNRGKSWNDAD